MIDDANHIEKKYFTISEVAELFQVNPSLIRFWETEFETLRPVKNKNGERRFTKRDIQEFKLIYHLVKEKGFTLEGAKEELKKQSEPFKDKLELVDALEKLKFFLVTLRDSLGENK